MRRREGRFGRTHRAAKHIKALVERIAPAVEAAKQQGLDKQAILNCAIRRNVNLQAEHLIDENAVLKELIHEGKLHVCGVSILCAVARVDLSEIKLKG